MSGLLADGLVAAETPEECEERATRIAAAAEADLVIEAFADSRPWSLDAHVEGLTWPDGHQALFEAAEVLREDDAFEVHLLTLELAGYSGDATDRLEAIRAAWEQKGRTVYRSSEMDGIFTITEIWTRARSLEIGVRAVASDESTFFQLNIHG